MEPRLYVNSVFKIALLLGAFALSACNMMPYETRINNVADQKWRITALAVYQAETGWLIRGKLSSPNRFGLPDGYILISFIDKEDAVIWNKEITYQEIVGGVGLPKRHQFGRALFSTYVNSIPKVAIVVAEFKIANSNSG
jgi:hypothetical protein